MNFQSVYWGFSAECCVKDALFDVYGDDDDLDEAGLSVGTRTDG